LDVPTPPLLVTRVAAVIYRLSPRQYPEFMLVQSSAHNPPYWEILHAPLTAGTTPLALFLRLVEHDAGFTQHGTPQPTSFQSKVPFWGEQLPPNVPAGNETSLSIEVPFGAVPQLAPRHYSDVRWVMVTDAVSLLRFPEHVALVMAVADAIDASHQR